MGVEEDYKHVISKVNALPRSHQQRLFRYLTDMLVMSPPPSTPQPVNKTQPASPVPVNSPVAQQRPSTTAVKQPIPHPATPQPQRGAPAKAVAPKGEERRPDPTTPDSTATYT
eukprot:Sspe_Gene.90871::Locus_62348_Transcript_1_1_Confidence_1.000_Length_680::g.90871::m.90871